MRFRLFLEMAMGVAVMVATRGDKALILRRGPTAPWQPGKWNLPGGMIDPSEGPLEAALRETREEAGVEVSGVRDLGQFGYVFAFAGEASSGAVRLTPTHGVLENDEYAWVDAAGLDGYEYADPVIRHVLELVLVGQSASGAARTKS